MNESIREEIEAALAANPYRIGQAYAAMKSGLPAREWAKEAWGPETTRPGTGFYDLVESLLTGSVPETKPGSWSKWVRLQSEQLRNRNAFSPEAEQFLLALEDECRGRESGSARTPLEAEAEEASEEADARNVPGVYVYSQPAYLRLATLAGEPPLVKVGKAGGGMLSRVAAQDRTSNAQDLVILRVYPAQDPHAAERAFHSILRGLGHAAPRMKTSGSEWFLADLDGIDGIAAGLGFKIERVAETRDFR